MIAFLMLLLLAAPPPGPRAGPATLRDRPSVAAAGATPSTTGRAVASPAAPSTPPPPAAADSVPVLPEVRVERDRVRLDARGRAPTAFTTDLRAGEAARALEALPDLIADAVGVRVTQYGGLGAFATVSLRGASPGQVAVYLDGTPMNAAARHELAWDARTTTGAAAPAGVYFVRARAGAAVVSRRVVIGW